MDDVIPTVTTSSLIPIDSSTPLSSTISSTPRSISASNSPSVSLSTLRYPNISISKSTSPFTQINSSSTSLSHSSRPLTSPVNIYRSPNTTTSITIPTNSSSNPSTSTPVYIPPPSPKPPPPTLPSTSPSIYSINAEINSSMNQTPIITSDPIIKSDDLLPFSERPFSPRDPTQITLNGCPIDRSTIPPISITDTDSDPDTDPLPSYIPSNLSNLAPSTPSFLPNSIDTNTDTTDDFPDITTITPFPPPSSIIRPASPTTRLTLPLDEISSPLPINPSITNSDLLINPAPPITTLNYLPSSNRLPTSRGRHPLPSIQQPIPVTSIKDQNTSLGNSPESTPPIHQQNIPPTVISSQQNIPPTVISSQQNIPPTVISSQQNISPPVNSDRQNIPPPVSSGKQNIPPPASIGRQNIPSPFSNGKQNIPPPASNGTQNIPSPTNFVQQNIPPTNSGRQNIPPSFSSDQQNIPSSNNVQQNIPPPFSSGRQNIPPPASIGRQNIPSPFSSSQQNIPPTASGGQQNIPPTASGGQQNIPPTASGSQQNIPPTASGSQQNIPPSFSNGRQNIPPPASGGRQNIPPPASGGRQNIPPPASGGRQNIPPPASGIRQPVPINGIRQPIPMSYGNNNQNITTSTSDISYQNNHSVEPGSSVVIDTSVTGVSNDTDKQPVPTSTVNSDILPPPNVPDYSSMTQEEQAQHRANFRTRFGILRNAWPSYHIPDIPDSVPLEQVHAQYDIYVRHIHISQDVDQYKVYLVIMWLIIELFCSKLGLNIGGYTVSQMRSMNKYERLLIELGENSYKSSVVAGTNFQSSWPVEVRIFFLALVNAVTFIVIKMLANYIGEGVATTIVDGLSSYLSGSPPQPGQTLFGGSSSSFPEQQSSQGPIPGGQPVPQIGGPFAGLDVASLIGNLGSMFVNRSNQPSAPVPIQQPLPQGATTPRRYAPAYEE